MSMKCILYNIEMYILGKDNALSLSEILASKYYLRWVNYYEKILAVTRSKKYHDNPVILLSIQFRMARGETTLWNTLQKGRKIAQKLRSKSNLTQEEKSELAGVEKQILIHKHLIRISRAICDGIGWRNLNFNRMYITSASRGFGSGAINIYNKDFQGEAFWAYRITEKYKSVVLLNDLTHYFRVGDLTEITPEGVPFIHEVKKSGRKVQNLFVMQNKPGKISRQEKRLLELQRIALKKEVQIGDKKVKYRHLETSMNTNLYKVSKMLNESKKQIFINERIEPFLTVEIINFRKAMKKGVDILQNIPNPKSDKKQLTLVHSNWDTFFEDEKGNFLRSGVPYSVYPFSVHNCINLLSGHYLLKSTLNITILKNILKERGWEIDDITEKELDKQIADFKDIEGKIYEKRYSLYENAPDEFGLFVIRKGPFRLPLTAAIYTRISMEFLSGQTFFDMLDEMYNKASEGQKGELFFPNFSDEVNVWK